jgi:hypothetical protein
MSLKNVTSRSLKRHESERAAAVGRNLNEEIESPKDFLSHPYLCAMPKGVFFISNGMELVENEEMNE